MLCGLAWGMGPLILFRALQGAGAGAIQPIATTIVGDIYTPAERARVQGYLSGVFGVAAIFGPPLGAFLVQYVSWSFVFWINLPIGAVSFAMLGRFLHERRQTRRHQHRLCGLDVADLGRRRTDAGADRGPELERSRRLLPSQRSAYSR